MIVSWILALAIVTGQLIKVSFGETQGATVLDFSLIFLSFYGLWKLKFKLSSPPLYIKAGLIFILIATLSLVLTPLHLTVYEYLISFSYTVRFSLFIFFGWLIYSGAFSNLKQNTLFILTFSGIGLALLGLLQFIFIPNLMFLQKYGWDPHYFRTVSTFLDPSFVGAYFILTLLLLTSEPLKILPRLKMPFFLLVYMALLTTFSRGSYLMFAISFLTLSLLKKSPKLTIVTVFLSLGLILGYNSYKTGVAEVRKIDKSKTAQFRLNSWQRGVAIFVNHPILGIGHNAYRYSLREYDLASADLLATRGGASNDSSFLQVLSTTGILGLISFLSFLFCLIFTKNKIILISALAGLIIHSFFANSLFYPFLLLWLILSATKL